MPPIVTDEPLLALFLIHWYVSGLRILGEDANMREPGLRSRVASWLADATFTLSGYTFAAGPISSVGIIGYAIYGWSISGEFHVLSLGDMNLQRPIFEGLLGIQSAVDYLWQAWSPAPISIATTAASAVIWMISALFYDIAKEP